MLHLRYRFLYSYWNIHVHFYKQKTSPSASTDIRLNLAYCFFTVKNTKQQYALKLQV